MSSSDEHEPGCCYCYRCQYVSAEEDEGCHCCGEKKLIWNYCQNCQQCNPPLYYHPGCRKNMNGNPCFVCGTSMGDDGDGGEICKTCVENFALASEKWKQERTDRQPEITSLIFFPLVLIKLIRKKKGEGAKPLTVPRRWRQDPIEKYCPRNRIRSRRGRVAVAKKRVLSQKKILPWC